MQDVLLSHHGQERATPVLYICACHCRCNQPTSAVVACSSTPPWIFHITDNTARTILLELCGGDSPSPHLLRICSSGAPAFLGVFMGVRPPPCAGCCSYLVAGGVMVCMPYPCSLMFSSALYTFKRCGTSARQAPTRLSEVACTACMLFVHSVCACCLLLAILLGARCGDKYAGRHWWNNHGAGITGHASWKLPQSTLHIWHITLISGV